MKSLYSLIFIFVLSACAGDTRQARDINWPADPSERLVAGKFLDRADADAFGKLPPGFAFEFRDIDARSLSDHFDYDLTELNRQQLLQAYQGNFLVEFFNDRRIQACKDRDARFLIDKDFKYEVFVNLRGSKKSETIHKELRKGFCVASELPLVNQQAIDARYNMMRRWPNGERVDIRLLEKLTGSFQLLAAKFDPARQSGKELAISDLKADGLMLSISLVQKHKKDTNLNKFWQQIAKGQSLEKNCVEVSHLAALTIGAVYSYRVDIRSNAGIVDSAVYTISYPDCLLYNRK